MNARVVAGKITAAVADALDLLLPARADFHSRSQCVPVALSSAQTKADPPITGPAAIFQQQRFSIDGQHNNIDPAVIVEVSQATAPVGLCRSRSGRRWDRPEPGVAILKHGDGLEVTGRGESPGVGVHMAICRPEVLVPVVVEIGKSARPAQERDRARPQPGTKGRVFVQAGLLLLVEREIVFRKRSRQEVQVAIVVIVTGGHAHVGLGAALSVQGHAAREARLFESSVSQVQVEVVRARIVGYKEIGSAVPIQVFK